MDMIGRIRRLYVRDKLSEREIARMAGLSRNTVSMWLRAPVAEAPKYRREARPNKLSAFETTLKQALMAYVRRPKHERRTARALHAEIKATGYDGGYSAVTAFVRARRQGEGQAVNVTAFVPLTGKLRSAFGKGLRAVTHVAFTLGLLAFCRSRHTPHTGFVVQDSPLLAYREPEGTDDDLRGTDLQEQFYSYLEGMSSDTQVIVVEIMNPPSSIMEREQSLMFSKNPHRGRHGLFPYAPDRVKEPDVTAV